MAVRWGILGAGKIASDFTTALSYVEDTKVIAVAARDKERANQFGDRFNIPTRYGSYQELVKDPNVDIVYVSTIHPEHHANILLCFQNGKSVLCEKPLTINAKQASELIVAAKKANVFFMEAMWTRFFPAITKVKELITSGEIGELQLLVNTFGFYNISTPRLVEPELGGGALLDIGVYQVSLTSFIFGGIEPSLISSTGVKHTTGVDIQLASYIRYGNQLANLTTTFLGEPSNTAQIIGTKGRIEIEAPFWSPSTISLTKDKNKETFHFPLPEKKPEHEFVFPNSIGMQYEAKHVIECLKAGKKESSVMPLQESLIIMQILDEMRRQVGVKYVGE